MADEPAARYPSDLTDAQWELIDPMVAVKPGGRPAEHSRRRIVDAILYVIRTGCAWRQLPHDFPPWATVFWYFKRWREDGVVDRLHDALRDRVRDAKAGIRWPRRAAWTLSRSGAPTPSARRCAGSTRARRSTAASATSWSTRWACCCWW